VPVTCAPRQLHDLSTMTPAFVAQLFPSCHQALDPTEGNVDWGICQPAYVPAPTLQPRWAVPPLLHHKRFLDVLVCSGVYDTGSTIQGLVGLLICIHAVVPPPAAQRGGLGVLKHSSSSCDPIRALHAWKLQEVAGP
jgi:hypothetical protein